MTGGEIIYRGLKLTSSKCNYFQVKQGKMNSLIEDVGSSTLVLTYSPGSSAKSLSVSLGIPLIGSGQQAIDPMSQPKRFSHGSIKLNGLTLEKLTYDPHTINIVLVEDSESRVVQTYDYTMFIVSQDDYKNPEFIKFLFYSGNLLYVKPVGPRVKGYELRNFPKLIIGDGQTEVESSNETIYSLRRRYNDYVIREIDYQDQFVIELRRILETYGIELVRINKERTLRGTSYITYQFNQSPANENHPMRNDVHKYFIQRKQPIEFTLHTTDMILYHDFKNKYDNVNLVTNFVEFKTTDRYGDRWTAAVKWSPISEDFNQVYQPDDNSNFALQCQFRCELYFYEVLDTRYEFLEEVVYRLELEDKYESSPPVEEDGKVTRDDNV